MNYTRLFDIQWDDSYNDPDFGVPGTMEKWLNNRSKADIERLAKLLEFLAGALRNRVAPFGPMGKTDGSEPSCKSAQPIRNLPEDDRREER